MSEVIITTAVGIAVGLLFGLVKLPIPAPPTLSGIMGITGIFLGYKISQYVMQNWDSIISALPF